METIRETRDMEAALCDLTGLPRPLDTPEDAGELYSSRLSSEDFAAYNPKPMFTKCISCAQIRQVRFFRV